MTARQIKRKLEKAGVSLDGVEISKGEIEICVGYYEENGYGFCDDEAVAKKHTEIAKVLPCFSGSYSTQYGARICPEGYKIMDEYDYCDVSNPVHY